jgi:methylenetetrahydrofolate--tRNA-(uracil-5-)-methyltransferase
LLKAEMEALGSVIMDAAREHEVPGGEALCVDRNAFAQAVTQKVASHPLIETVTQEWAPNDDRPLVVATGPLSTEGAAQWLARLTGRKRLYFYDAVSPTVEASSIDTTIAFRASRHGRGTDDYLNCPFEKDEYLAFVRALVSAERVPLHAFEAGGVRDGAGPDTADGFIEKVKYFSGCMPIEAIAEQGERSLAFGNFKPVGLTDPRTGRRPYAVLQLRPENRERSLYSLVACQNRLRFGEQRRVFRMVPGLQNAEFVRYGVIHRNTYLDAPRTIDPWLRLLADPQVRVAGQLTGVEGYLESAATGIWAGIAAAWETKGTTAPLPPRSTALGSLLAHLGDDTEREFAPMNINWGLLPDPRPCPTDKTERRALKLEAARQALAVWLDALEPAPTSTG